ncbi:MAG: hypothetical protein KID00_16520, partial [Clostridium argentinense]|nr:hypothetical protein [Clostridium argentinense]
MVVVETLAQAVEIEKNVEYNYVYKLLESSYGVDVNGKTQIVQAYGIEVEREDVIKGKKVSQCRDFVKYISPKKEKVGNIMKMLYQHLVSPIHLIDVIGEYVDECVNDFDE